MAAHIAMFPYGVENWSARSGTLNRKYGSCTLIYPDSALNIHSNCGAPRRRVADGTLKKKKNVLFSRAPLREDGNAAVRTGSGVSFGCLPNLLRFDLSLFPFLPFSIPRTLRNSYTINLRKSNMDTTYPVRFFALL